MADTIRWGILGAASIARRRVVPALQAASNGVVTAVASRDLAKARAFAAELHIAKVYGSYDDLLADPDIDAVYNPLPNSLHAQWMLKSAAAGKPMLCEKPFTASAADAETAVRAFEARGLLLAEAFMYRFHPQTERLQALIASGAVGQLVSIAAAFSFSIRSEDDIRLNRSLAGGALLDVGCYPVSLMRLLTGEEPTRAAAFARVGPVSGVDESLTGMLQFPSGVVGHFDCGLRAFRTNWCEIRGTNGRIVLEKVFNMEPGDEPVIRLWCGEAYEEIRCPAANHYRLMVEDFAAALLDSRPPRFGGDDALNNTRALDLLLAAAGL